MHLTNLIKKYFPILALALVFYSCGVWENFTTYFNLYYNTKHLFNEAEDSINQDRADIFAPVEAKIKPSDDQKLEKVIEKCSKILQYRSDSRYVDDALLILGKSFYYQKNFLKSTREFDELLQTQPDSDLRLEAQLWLGKAQLRLNDTEKGLATLKSVRETAADQGETEILEGALIEEIKYKISVDDLAGAVKSASDFLNISENDEFNQKIAFELGRLEEELNNYDEAIAAYQKVQDYSPAYQMELDAKLALGKAYIEGGYYDKAYALFDDMSSLDKNKDVLDKIDLEKGITLAHLNRYSEALDVLTQVDTLYKGSAYAGAARYEMGKIYEDVYNNFDSASAYYSRAGISLVPTNYAQDVSAKMTKFRKYNELHKQLLVEKNQYEYAQNPEKFVEDSTKFFDQLKEYQKKLAELKNDEDKGRALLESRRDRDLKASPEQSLEPKIDISNPPKRPAIPEDSIKTRIINSEFELGNLFFSELNRPDSAYYYYNKVLLADPPRDIEANTLFVLGNYFLTEKDSVKADSVFNVLYQNFKDQSIVNSAAAILNRPLINFDYDPAQELYAKAEKQMLDKNYRESLAEFKNIYENYPSSPRAPKALYASGWVFENELLNPDSAAAYYDTLKSRYPQSEYALNVAPKVYEYNQEQKRLKKLAEDSLRVLEQQKKMKDKKEESEKPKIGNIPEEQLKKLPPGLRFEARQDTTGKNPDNEKLKENDEKIFRPIPRDSLIQDKKNKSIDTLRTR